MASYVFGRQGIADFIKLYIVLIAIPLIPHILTWARDFDATARRMRFVDHATKVVSFWDNWIKTLATIIPAEGYKNAGTESLIREVTAEARHLMADIGLELIDIYRRRELRELREFPLSYKEFQAYRAGLPLWRRALLLYKSPNPRARAMKFTFQLYFWTTVVGSTAIPLAYLFRDLIRTAIWQTAPWILHRSGWDAFLDVHPIACGVLFYAYTIGIISFYHRRSVRYESHPSYFPRDRARRRFFEDNEGAPG